VNSDGVIVEVSVAGVLVGVNDADLIMVLVAVFWSRAMKCSTPLHFEHTSTLAT